MNNYLLQSLQHRVLPDSLLYSMLRLLCVRPAGRFMRLKPSTQ